MSVLRRQSLIAYAAPLRETVVECPQPRGSEVLVRVERCGVCHSDLHIQDGHFRLGADNVLDIRAGRALPFTLGHEIVGVIERAGPAAEGVTPGRSVAVYPWIGCGSCGSCRRGEENICAAPRHLGINLDGGFASHVLVPDGRYLLDYEPLSRSFAATLMCSGLTAYAALKRLGERAAQGPLLLVGLGGVGMMALVLARAMFKQAPLAADIDPSKRAAALAAGASEAFDPADSSARKAVLAASGGGVHGACDFVGSDRSLAFATGALAKGGRVAVTGLFGGTFTMPAVMFPLKAIAVEGIQTGTLDEAREVIALARNVTAPPIVKRPIGEADGALAALRAGQVVGRVVLSA